MYIKKQKQRAIELIKECTSIKITTEYHFDNDFGYEGEGDGEGEIVEIKFIISGEYEKWIKKKDT